MRKKALITLRRRIAVSLKRLTLFHLIFLIFFLLAISKVGHAQTYFSYLDSSYYLLFDEIPDKNMIELAPEGYHYPNILLYNIPIHKPESELDYLLTISILFTDHRYFYSKKQISESLFQKKKISFDKVQELVIATVDSSLNTKYHARSSILKTYKIIPVIKQYGNFYAYAKPVLSECFGIIRKPAPFQLEKLSREDWVYLTEEVAPFFRAGILNLSAPIISRQEELRYAWWIIDEGNKEHFPLQYDGKKVDSVEAVNFINNQFTNRILLRSVDADGTYHFEYLPAEEFHGPPRTGLTSFYYHPCLGIIAATYEYHFEKYHRWIPGVKRVEDVMFTGRFINGVEYEHYFRMKCLE